MNNYINILTPIKILVIEDNPGDFFLLQEYIEEMFVNAVIAHAANYLEAEKILSEKESNFDSILLDVTLPDNHGAKLVSDVLFLANQCPVMILTGYENLDFSIHSLSQGVSEYLLKDETTPQTLHKSILFSIERKKYSKNIEESENRYSKLFHLSPIPMWVYETSNFKIIQANYAAIKRYGYSEEEFLSMSILDLFPSKETKDMVINHSNYPIDSSEILIQQIKSGKKIQVQIEQNFINIQGVHCCIMLSNDITELVETQESLRTAYKNIIKIEEKEKEKFATELHDGLQQNIVAAKLIFDFLKEQTPQLGQEPRAIMLNQSLDKAFDECSQLIRNVRPKGIIENGFFNEIEALIKEVKATGRIEITLNTVPAFDQIFPYYSLMHIYRIVQELFTNSMKHASASHFDLNFFIQGNQLNIIFKDNGKGLSNEMLESKTSFISIKRRIQILGGKMEVTSSPNNGVEFSLNIPIEK